MSTLTTVALAAAVIIFFLVVELASAALPLLIVIAFVPHQERDALAALIGAIDSRRRLRLWPALRVAVDAQRRHHTETRGLMT
ncbi:hypothetical protein [Actinoplanes rectilineatus]|uniref:hypothetical protein n=1 Tax=Actinoplanes rectilineatus TaxID=113571 RepID=UPI0005F282C4|nr:hypothetical protein [Actinoplanes rectilineatus]